MVHFNSFGPYKLGKTIGQGEFGKVKLGIHSITSTQVAVKLVNSMVLMLGKMASYQRRQKLIREIEILQQVEHKHIVKLHEVIETDSYIGMVMGYAEGGELFDYILSKRYLKDQEACRLFSQLIMGVSYLHSKGIVHRDLKLENLLLSSRDLIISDFGFANRFSSSSDDLLSTSCGSPCYAAPELVINSTYLAEGADIWSCGVILYAMLAGYLPFDDDPENVQGDNINQLYKYIMETKLTYPQQVSNLAKDLISKILVTNPEKRANMREIQAHAWLKPYHSLFPTTVREPFMVQTRVEVDQIKHMKPSDSKRFSISGQVRTSMLPDHPDRKSSLDPHRMSNMSVVSARSNTPPPRSITPPMPPILRPIPLLKEEKRVPSIIRKPSPGPSNLNPLARSSSPIKGIVNPTEVFGIPRSSSPSLKPAVPSPLTASTTPSSIPYDAFEEYNIKISTAPTTMVHPDLKMEVLPRTSADLPRQKAVNDYDRAKSMDQTRVHNQDEQNSGLNTKVQKEDEELMYIRFHSGPIDQRVLTSQHPNKLITLIKKTCLSLNLEIISSTTDPYKFKVLRKGIIRGGFVNAILDRISLFGRDRGYDGIDVDKTDLPPPDQESIKVYISIRRIKNLKGLYTVDFKRVRGDIWQFKRVYEDFVEALDLKV